MTRHSLLPSALARAPHALSKTSGHWPLSLLGTAVAVVMAAISADVHALGLGRLSVKSALGEPLRAEIDVNDLTSSEASDLQVRMASPNTFNAAGIGYNPALANVRTMLQRRSDGRYVVQLIGDQPMNDPFVDLLLEANWRAGQLTRDYTVLLNPPATSQQAAAPILTPVPIAPVVPAAQPRPAPQIALPAPPLPSAIMPSNETPHHAAQRAMPAKAPVAKSANPQKVTVDRGDTASMIAHTYKPDGISLDQMLIAMLRANPDAFIGGNVNRMKAGAILDMPSAQQAAAVSPDEAHSTIVAQSRDFNDYRRRLAENAPGARVARAGRQAGGKLDASVEDRSAARTSPDHLTVSPGRREEKLAQNRQAQEQKARVDELSKNLDALKKLEAQKSPVLPGASTAAPASPAAVEPVLPNATVDTPAPTDSPNASSSGFWPSLSTKFQGFLREAQGNRMILLSIALPLLLLALLIYLFFSRRRSGVDESIFMETQLPKDAVDTRPGEAPADRAQALSAAPHVNEVDPIAEADVYLAYGRDVQAEEILQEALRRHPERNALRLKLLEIYAKRRDSRAYEAFALEMQKRTPAASKEWARVVELGRTLDPSNSLYQEPKEPVVNQAVATVASPVTSPTTGTPAPTVPSSTPAPPVTAPASLPQPSMVPFDFNLDLDLDKMGPSKPVAVTSTINAAPFSGAAAFSVVPSTAKPSSVPATDSGFIQFTPDVSSSKKPRIFAPAETEADESHSPYADKLTLARELHALGDAEAARSLAEEVANAGVGKVRHQAQQLLDELG